MQPLDLARARLRKTETKDKSAPKLKAEVEGLSSDHDQVFMSFNIEHWYPLLGPTRTAYTTLLPITAAVAICLVSLHEDFNSGHLPQEDIPSRLLQDPEIAMVVEELQELIQEGGSFMKTSARSCKDVSLEIGLKERYREVLATKVKACGTKLDDMKLRSLFMEAGRKVLKFNKSLDFVVACVMSRRVHGDLKRGLGDKLKSPLSFVVREWMPSCPPEFEFRCFVVDGQLTAITQYIPTIYSPALIQSFTTIRSAISRYFAHEIQQPLSTLYARYAVDIVLLNFDFTEEWKFVVIEVNPFFELTGEGLFDNAEGREIMNGRASVEYPVMRVQSQRLVDPTEKNLLSVRRAVERELGVQGILDA